MTISELLNNTSSAQKEQMLERLLSFAFRPETSGADTEMKTVQMDFDQEINGGDLVDALAVETNLLKTAAEKNQATLQDILDSPGVEDWDLDEEIHERFLNLASETNNLGAGGQIRHLVVENGESAETVRKIAEEATQEN